MSPESRDVLRLDDLRVSFRSAGNEVEVVRGVSFSVGEGEAVALVGESGCGKSVTAQAILGLTPPPGQITGGRAVFGGRDVAGLGPKDLRGLRGREIGMVFQEPMTSLDPVFTVGYQLEEAFRPQGSRRGLERRALLIEALAEVGISDPEARLSAYPWQLSGGLRQRVMIAMAVACRPKLLIADEPTTALDVTVQAQIMALLGELRRRRRMALLLITHDLGLVAQHADRAVVMYAGHVVEEARVEDLFDAPLHPYTQGLLGSMPTWESGVAAPGKRLEAIPGTVPPAERIPTGCPFRDRCYLAVERCSEGGVPALEEMGAGHRVRCLRVERRV